MLGTLGLIQAILSVSWPIYALPLHHPLCEQGGLWGAALSLHHEIPELGLTDRHQIDRMKAQGFESISFVIHWHQDNIYSHQIRAQGKEWVDDPRLINSISYAKRLGLKVMLFPIIWLEHRKAREWRGVLKPTYPKRWWKSYRKFIIHYARISQDLQIEWLSIGSELSSMEAQYSSWQDLIHKVRNVYTGRLIYSANWDHYQDVPFWNLLDAIGMTAYYEIAGTPGDSVQSMQDSWNLIRSALHEWHAYKRFHIPIVFTEIGYTSQVGSATHPWNYNASTHVDLQEQSNAYQAFTDSWKKDQLLCAAFFWNSWGLGGLQDSWYTLTGKPALSRIQSFIKARKRDLQSH